MAPTRSKSIDRPGGDCGRNPGGDRRLHLSQPEAQQSVDLILYLRFDQRFELTLRPPAVMAKAAASIDVLSGGRFELGLGAGNFWDAIEAHGGPRRTPGEALAALEEAIEVIRKVWSGERNLRFEGQC
jgi:hypothetical protein